MSGKVRAAKFLAVRTVLRTVALLLPLLSVACTPALVTVLESHKLLIVESKTGEPVEGVAVLVEWHTGRLFGATETLGAASYVSDPYGRVHIGVRIVPGFYSATRVLKSESITVFKSGGWKSESPYWRSLGWGEDSNYALETAADGVLVIPMDRIPPKDLAARGEAVGSASLLLDEDKLAKGDRFVKEIEMEWDLIDELRFPTRPPKSRKRP